MVCSQEIREIAEKIQHAGGKLYLVGGALRDEMMEKEIGDSIKLSFKKKGAYVFTEDGNRIR